MNILIVVGFLLIESREKMNKKKTIVMSTLLLAIVLLGIGTIAYFRRTVNGNITGETGNLVLIVNESATELIGSGLKPFGNDSLSMIDFQEIVLKYQLNKEKLVEETANKYYSDKEIVIIYDRGICDYKAYIGEYEYYKLLDKYNLNENNILNNFDLVIHLETAAKNKDYTLENNNARSESKSEAIELDNKIFDAWKIHKNIFKIKASDDFLIKQNDIIKVIKEFFNK